MAAHGNRYWRKNHGLYEHNQRARGHSARGDVLPPGVDEQLHAPQHAVRASRKEPRTFGTVSCSEGGGIGDMALWDILYDNNTDDDGVIGSSQQSRDGHGDRAPEPTVGTHGATLPTPSL